MLQEAQTRFDSPLQLNSGVAAPAERTEAAAPAAYFLTAEDLARAGLLIACNERRFRGPQIDANGRAHHPDTGRFINSNDAYAVQQTVHQRVFERLTQAVRRRAEDAQKIAVLGLGRGGQRSILATLDAQQTQRPAGDLYLDPYQRGRRPQSAKAARILAWTVRR